MACGVHSALGTSVPSGHCQRGHTEQQGMDVADEVPKPKGLQCQRVPGLAALAAMENVKSEKQGGEDSGLDDPICIGGTVLHTRCVSLEAGPVALNPGTVRAAWAFVSRPESRRHSTDDCPALGLG